MRVDVAIVGAGPAGLCLARALSGQGLSVAVVERQPATALADPAFDGREIALTRRSRRFLQSLGIWRRLGDNTISPLRQARVLDGDSPFALDIQADPADASALGWLVSNHRIRRAAWEEVCSRADLQMHAGVSVTAVHAQGQQRVLELDNGEQLATRLLVAADGRFSAMRRMLGVAAPVRDFGRTMFLCTVQHTRAHEGVALEWFCYGRTIALLPLLGCRSSLVLTLPTDQAQALLALPVAQREACLTAWCAGRLGDMTVVSDLHAYPLTALYARRLAGPRFALLGDAAVGMHPVTAHGFNFGLQGAQRLASRLQRAHAQSGDAGAAAGLLSYATAHRRATWPLYQATNLVAKLYADDSLPARFLRQGALRVAAGVPPFRQALLAQLSH